MRNTSQERSVLEQADCVEIALALRVLANHIRTEAQSEAGKELPTSVGQQAARLETIASRFEKSEGIEFSIEGLIHSLASQAGEAVDAMDFCPADLAVVAAAIELLGSRLAADGDSHAERIKALATKTSMAREHQEGLLAAIDELAGSAGDAAA